MNKPNIIESLDQLFGNFEKVDLKSLDTFLQDILKLFSYLQEKLNSKDEAEKKEAMELAEQLQAKLNTVAQKAYAASGLTPEKIEQFVSNRKNFDADQWAALQNLQGNINNYQSKIIP